MNKNVLKHVENLRSEDRKVAIRAEKLLIQHYAHKSDDQLIDLLINVCGDSNPYARLRAVWVLAHTHSPRAYEPILKLTYDPVDTVRYDAMIALGILGDHRGIARLVSVLSSRDMESSTDSAAANGLEYIGKPAIPAILEKLEVVDNPVTQSTIAWLLGRIGDDSVINPLLKLMSVDNDVTRVYVLDAMGDINTSESIAVIARYLKDKSPTVSETAKKLYSSLKSS